MNDQGITLADIEAALAGVADAFKDAPADSGSIYQPPPDGDYEALVHKFEFLGGDWGIGLKVNYQVTNSSQYAGRIVGDLFSITPDRIGWLKGFLSRLDVNTEELDVQDLRPGSPLLERLLDTPVLIKIKRTDGTDRQGNSRQFVNVYLQRKLGEPGSNAQGFTPAPVSDIPQGDFDFAPAGRNASGPADDDIPF